MVMRVAQAVVSATIVTEPDIIAGLVQLDGHGLTKLR